MYMYILGRYVRVVNVGWEGDAMTRRDVNKGSETLWILRWSIRGSPLARW